MSKIKLLFATNNAHKLREIRGIAGNDYEIIGLMDVGFEGDIPETQDTIEANAVQKARYIFEKIHLDCFADDTGLEIDALDGRPGVYSARYAGENCSFDDNIRRVLKELEGVGNRKARFRCVICLISDGNEYLFEGRIEGTITEAPHGKGGFGYDPVFVPDGYNQTFAEIPAYLKNGISHRGRAMTKMMNFLKRTS